MSFTPKPEWLLDVCDIVKAEHRINYGRLFPSKTHYKADCTCGWSSEGDRETVYAAVRKHEDET